MQWIDINVEKPNINTEFLCSDGEHVWIGTIDNFTSMVTNVFYECVNNKCNYTWDYCSCSYDCLYWMPLPNQPERLSEKTPQGDAIV